MLTLSILRSCKETISLHFLPYTYSRFDPHRGSRVEVDVNPRRRGGGGGEGAFSIRGQIVGKNDEKMMKMDEVESDAAEKGGRRKRDAEEGNKIGRRKVVVVEEEEEEEEGGRALEKKNGKT